MNIIYIQTENGTLPIEETDIPAEILKYGFEFEIEVSKVWALETPTLDFPIKDLLWHLNITPWDHDGKPLTIGPKEVMDSPELYPEHFEKIKNADLSYPIDISYNNGKWVIVDGLHRLCFTVISGANAECDKVKVRIHSREAILSCIDKKLTAPHILKKYGIQRDRLIDRSSLQLTEKPEELNPLTEVCVFSPSQHFAFSVPERVVSLVEIGYSAEFTKTMACETAYTTPFRLLSNEGLEALRKVADNILKEKRTLSNGALDEFGNAAYLSPFVKALAQSAEIRSLLSEITKTAVVPYVREHFLAALNVGKPAKKRPVRNWHSDYQSMNLIVFLDDPKDFKGGKLQVYKGTKEEADALLRVQNYLNEDKVETIIPPAAGYAVLLQGSLVMHAVTALDSADPDRRTLVLGYRSNLLGKYVFEHSDIAPDHPLCRYPEAAKQAASIAIQKLTAFLEADLYTGDPNLIVSMLDNSLSDVHKISELLKAAPKIG